ncbi:DNA-3-methyladenine glycosylase family protein [Neolewinella antarctica]|uniref:DNA-3-methyladenine glycosylase II n=1 Tax=Neolewinella antarctica TaxID=442734 RepID=A0ABX0XEG1_9BACT|nr:DNA-3-methyladenine glycosylase 2 family protein [Neolewinella antarctica]NJC27592.1 DNA-3-methyladenine glycosylase II [Neolewinella antarctica]
MSEIAIAHLRQQKLLAPLIKKHTPKIRPDHDGDVYFGLIRSITYQQLSGKAAGTIFGRFLDLFPDGYPHPDCLLEMDDRDLRAAGMSRNKAAYLKNVAQYWLDHRLINTDWNNYTDQEILKMLTSIKGVGQWTVEMVLMFVLHREDLLPLGDLVVKRNVIQLFGVDTEKFRGKKLVAELFRLTEGWRPFRSYASRLLWEVG